MKKVLILGLVLVFVAVIVAIVWMDKNLDNNVPVSAVWEYERVQEERNWLYRELNDETLWTSSYRVKNLASCIDKRRNYGVTLLCKFTDKNSGLYKYHFIELGEYRAEFLGDFYRESYGEMLSRDVAKNKYIIYFNKEGYQVEILGGIIAWSNRMAEYSLCDLNGDGQWDYSANEWLYPASYISGSDPAYNFEDGYKVCLDSSKEIVVCSGKERFSDIERKFR